MIIRNIGQLVTMDPGLGRGELGLISNAALLTENGRVQWVGVEKGLTKKILTKSKHHTELDAQGRLVTPGLIDCHTHIAFAGSRSDEFFERLSELTAYEKIAKKGGGIARTVAATRNATTAELASQMKARLDRFLKFGVTTVEVKSGYGLSVNHELRLLKVIQSTRHPINRVSTFLGAHVVPKEFYKRRGDYVDVICLKMLPRVARARLAQACDVFCDRTAFTISEARQILRTATKLGLKTKLHADQLSSCGGAELAAEMNALSADHLEYVSDRGMRAMAKRDVVAVLLPGAVFSLGKRSYPSARKLIQSGVKVAVSTDCNPGTSWSENLPLMMSLAATELRMSLSEIWRSVTSHAALALGIRDRGALQPGAFADIVVWDAEDPADVPYHVGASFARHVICAGKRVR